MQIFEVGLSSNAKQLFEEAGIETVTDDVLSETELREFLQLGVDYAAVIINLDANPWGMRAPQHLRSKKILTPIIGIAKREDGMLWSRKRISFFDQGGNDLISAMADPRELVALVRSRSRRESELINKTLNIFSNIREFRSGDACVKINMETEEVTVNGKLANLPYQQQRMLTVLASRIGQTQSHETILNNISMPASQDLNATYVPCRVRLLRARLSELHPDAGKIIETVWGSGYRMNLCIPLDGERSAEKGRIEERA